MGGVAILMPTLRRPDSLERALRSLFADPVYREHLRQRFQMELKKQWAKLP